MRVVLDSIDEFLKEIVAEHNRIHRSIVRFRIDREPQDSEGVVTQVSVWATAVIDHDDGKTIVECCAFAGLDSAMDQSTEGTMHAMEWLDKTRHYCDDMQLILRPGKFELE